MRNGRSPVGGRKNRLSFMRAFFPILAAIDCIEPLSKLMANPVALKLEDVCGCAPAMFAFTVVDCQLGAQSNPTAKPDQSVGESNEPNAFMPPSRNTSVIEFIEAVICRYAAGRLGLTIVTATAPRSMPAP